MGDCNSRKVKAGWVAKPDKRSKDQTPIVSQTLPLTENYNKNLGSGEDQPRGSWRKLTCYDICYNSYLRLLERGIHDPKNQWCVVFI